MSEALNWDGLRSFLAVARAGRLTVAARHAGIDHSTLSRRIGALETSLGVRLFHRQVSGYSLTSQGEQVMRMAEAIESLLIGVTASLSDTKLAVEGTVRVGAPEGFGTRFLASRLGRLSELYPGIEIQLIALPRTFSLSKREADIAIGLDRPQEGRLKARLLTQYELGLYASREYLARHGAPAGTHDLPSHRFIGYISDLIYAPELDYLPLIARSLRTAFTSSSLLAQEQATLAGDGICMLPCFMADAQATLVRVLADEVLLKRAFWLIVHADTAGRAAVRVVSDYIAACVVETRASFLPPCPML